MFDTCPYCDSWNLRRTPSIEGDHCFCRDCGESWVDNDENNSSLWQPDEQQPIDDPDEAG